MAVELAASSSGRSSPPQISLVLIYVRILADPVAIVGQLNIMMAGIEPGTFQLLVQFLN
jgi:hypothetical protein